MTSHFSLPTSPLPPRRIAIRPPEYLPRLSYLALMQHVDVFILADTFQYSRQSFQNRTRIRTPQGWHWLSAPLLGRQHGRPIWETQIDNRPAWASKHRRALQYNYRQTPFYDVCEEEIRAFYATERTLLGDLTCASVAMLHRMFGCRCRLSRASELAASPASNRSILETVEADVLVLPDAVFARDARGDWPLERFLYEEPLYRQHFEGFEREMSALDLFLNYGQEAASILSAGREARDGGA